MWSGHSCPLALISTPQQIFVIPILRRSRRGRNLLLDGALFALSGVQFWREFDGCPISRAGLCARSGDFRVRSTPPPPSSRTPTFGSPRLSAWGRRDPTPTRSIPRSEACRHQSQAGTSKTLSKGQMSQFPNLHLWKTSGAQISAVAPHNVEERPFRATSDADHMQASAPVVVGQNRQPTTTECLVPEGQLKIARRFNAGYPRNIGACPGGAPDP
jgi:hypothetical protein